MGMQNHDLGTRSVYRKTPYGEFDKVEGNALYFRSGGHVDFDEVFETREFCEMNNQGYSLIRDLVDEVTLLRKLLMEQLRQSGIRITDANEYHRNVASLAGKIGEDPKDLRILLDPMVRTLFSNMFARKQHKQPR